MSLTFTITAGREGAYETPITYAGVSTSNGRQALDFDPGAPDQLQFRFHPPGVAGNYLVRDGTTGANINVVMRYVGATKDAAEALYISDVNTFCYKPVKILCNGQVYLGLNVRPSSIRRVSPIKPIGRGSPGQVFFNVSMTFTIDSPYGV